MNSESEHEESERVFRHPRRYEVSKEESPQKPAKKKKSNNEQLAGKDGGYAWEDEIQRSWDMVQEDTGGNISSVVQQIIEARKKKLVKNVTPFQRGIIRTMIMVLDCSVAMAEKDLRPNRYAMTVQYGIDFVHEFFDQNPISQLGIVIMRNGIAELVSEVSGNPQDHIEVLKAIRKMEPSGDPSLQNALEMCRGMLSSVAQHCTREVTIIFGALLTSDPGDIHQTIKTLVDERIRVRIIGLSAQVSICKQICKETNYGDDGLYGVILNEVHFKELLTAAVVPLPVNKVNKGFTLVKMGFPTRTAEDTASLCACHSKPIYGGYNCPQCQSKVCNLPTVCPSCNLMLILSTHLARSYHHLIPLAIYDEVAVSENYPTNHCYSCQLKFPHIMDHETHTALTSSRYRCGDCGKDFCIDCDVFIHEMLHNCPGCDSK